MKRSETDKWSWTERVGWIVGIVVGIPSIIAAGFALWSWLAPGMDAKVTKLLPGGVWSSEYSFSGRVGINKVTAATEFFENGTYRSEGQQSLIFTADGKEHEFLYGLLLTGKWQIIERQLIVESVGFDSPLRSIRVDSDVTDMGVVSESKLRERFPQFPFLKDRLIQGTPGRFAIVRFTKDLIRFRAADKAGGFFEYDAVRR